jgi:hypothetical protein
MAFSPTQLRALQRDLDAHDIRTRQSNGRELSYIEGWHAISEANRIFGFDAWNRETIESKCLLSRETRGAYHAVYVAKVRITVRSKDQTVIRDGFGAGEAQCATMGEAHDKAIKTAETDATKRALATFGKPFGLALYLGQRSRGDAQPEIRNPSLENGRRRTLQKLGPSGRFYVPRRATPPIDPDLAATSKSLAATTTNPPPPDSGDGIRQVPGESTATADRSGRTRDAASGMPSQNLTGAPHPAQTALEPRVDHPDLLLARAPRRKEPAHLRYIATQPCLVCGRTPSDAHHLRFAQPRALGRKVSDEFSVPLCRTHHRQLHQTGDEVQWWLDVEIDPLPIARDLWAEFQRRSSESVTVLQATASGDVMTKSEGQS